MLSDVAIAVSDHFLGSVRDFEIMQRMKDLHLRLTRKLERENSVSDLIVYDKGYEVEQ